MAASRLRPSPEVIEAELRLYKAPAVNSWQPLLRLLLLIGLEGVIVEDAYNDGGPSDGEISLWVGGCQQMRVWLM